MLKSDNELAIVKVLIEALRELRIHGVAQVLEEHPPEYNPQAKGAAEFGVNLLKGHFRTIRSGLQSKIGFRGPGRHPLVAWMIRHAAGLIAWCPKGHDGQTAYRRVQSRAFSKHRMASGESCSFK